MKTIKIINKIKNNIVIHCDNLCFCQHLNLEKKKQTNKQTNKNTLHFVQSPECVV